MMLSTTAVKPTINTMGPGMPVAHPMALGMNPYAMYYPPGMPMSPNTPTYPYANPYYYMAPMPGPNGMYPTSPNFVPPNAQRPPPPDVQRQAKPKRLKAHTVTSKNFSIPMVPRDKSGKPMLPLNVGIMTVIKLGDVCMREHFHTERYIFPVGYEVSRYDSLGSLSRVQTLIHSCRRYLSTVDPNIEVVYHCTILDGGDGPKFQIIPSDVPDRPVIAGTATGAWSSIVKQANAIRNRQHSNSVSGPDFFGLGQNTIKHLIQELPNADRLRDYVWQRFIEGGYVLRLLYDQRSDGAVLLDLWVDVMQLLFRHYLRNSMLPILSVLYITKNRKTRVMLHQHHPRKVYIIIHSTSSNRLCSSKRNSKVNSNRRVVLRGCRQTPLGGVEVITQIIKITTQNIRRRGGQFVMALQVATAIPQDLHAVLALAPVHRLSNPTNLRSQILPT
jgi:hypothetical protein